MGTLFVLTGPSCAGKGPLVKSLRRWFPDALAGARTLVLYNDRDPRPGEVDGEDYRFRPTGEIEPLADDENFLVRSAWGDLQAVDLRELRDALAEGDVLYEGNPYVAGGLWEQPLPEGCRKRGVFLSPLSRAEIEEARSRGVELKRLVTNIMRRRLLRRTTKQKQYLSLPALERIERRAGSAWEEMRAAGRYDCVVPNHDGEDHENWTQFAMLTGDARLATRAVADVLAGRKSDHAETWPDGLLD